MAKQEAKTAMPRLRFPEFRKANSWRDGTLVDYATVVAGQSPEGAYYNETGEGLPFYQGKADFGEIFLERPRKWTSQVTKRAGAGDIVMSVRAPVGALNVTTEDICIGRGLAAIQAKGSKWFLYYLLNSVSSSIIGNGGSVFDSINKDQIEKLRLFAPRDAAEQQKIADCLTSLDEVIAAQGRKVEALKAHKRGLMQQLFPREGETRPRLRFPEFRDAPEWRDTRLSKLGKLVSGLTYSPDDVRHEGLLVLRSSNVQNGEISLDDNVYVTPDIRGANLSQPNDILICVRNGSKALIGKSALIPDGMPVCTHGAFMTVFRAEVPKFAFQLMQSACFRKQVAADLGATINSINGSQLLRYRFAVPGQDEQKRIADCLSSLDSRIAAESNRLAALKTHKQGLMQQLFPVPEAT